MSCSSRFSRPFLCLCSAAAWRHSCIRSCSFIPHGTNAPCACALVAFSPSWNNCALRVALFGCCALTVLFVDYLLDRHRTVRQLKQQILAELERIVELQHQASVDQLHSIAARSAGGPTGS